MSAFLFALFSCSHPSTTGSSGRPGTTARGLLDVFPSAELVGDDGKLAIPEGALPQAEGGTPFPVDRVNWRDGFSVVQTSVITLDVQVDPASLPGLDALDAPGSVQMWDLDTGEWIRTFAEVDANDTGDELPVVLVRPMEPMTPGHRVAVAVTTDVRTVDGQSLEPVPWFAAAVAGRPGDGVDGAHYQALAQQLEALGVTNLALAFDFPVGDGTLPLTSVLVDLSTPSSHAFTIEENTDDGDDLPPGIWKRLAGTFPTDNWLVDDLNLQTDDAGVPQKQGTTDAKLYAYIPESARDAPPGTVPVWLFGHGIFGKPDDYLDDPEDSSAVEDLANRAGAIVIATVWRGLTRDDEGGAIDIAYDFGKFPLLTDRLVQGMANTVALGRLALHGDLFDDPVFEGLPDPSHLYYYGISLGGIEGAVLMANDSEVEHGVLHVGGSDWSTMLERSTQFITFSLMVGSKVASARDRQLLYSASQLFWDPVDPADYAAELQGRSVLWQEAIGDDQVPNMTTELLARGVGATLLEPSVTTPAGIPTAPAPLIGPALAQFDPETPDYEDTNTQSAVTGAHSAIRTYEGARKQTLRFLDPDDPGVVETYCGDAPCSKDNPGG